MRIAGERRSGVSQAHDAHNMHVHVFILHVFILHVHVLVDGHTTQVWGESSGMHVHRSPHGPVSWMGTQPRHAFFTGLHCVSRSLQNFLTYCLGRCHIILFALSFVA